MIYTHSTKTFLGWTTGLYFDSIESEYMETEQEAKEWAEARMNEIKKEFILSLIVEEGNNYRFGKHIEIFYRYDDRYCVFVEELKVFKGTLEECKNYIVSCF